LGLDHPFLIEQKEAAIDLGHGGEKHRQELPEQNSRNKNFLGEREKDFLHNRAMPWFFYLILGLVLWGYFPSSIHAELNPKLQSPSDSYYDETIDYSHFIGRVTDRGDANNVLKIESENHNTKLFQVGDVLEFTVPGHDDDASCDAFVRGVEDGYFVVYVRNIRACWQKDDFFRRGTRLNFHSKTLADRVRDASMHRLVLIQNKSDFFKQLNEINHFLWSYDQKRLQLAAEYDRKIADMEKDKQRAMELYVEKKKDNIRMQQELSKRLDLLEKDMDYYRIEKDEPLVDRWHDDLDLGLPVGNRPQDLKSQ
ncbi:MAG: hypothetical protein WCG27_05560, partial [Pseudomonadota bacterium]